MYTYPVSEAITDLRSEFEGGKAMSLDFYTLLKRGARNTLDNINPETLKRRVPIYGGVANNLALYYCPEDVRVPVAIYRQPHDRQPVATYVPPTQFFTQNKNDVFTIEHINGVRFVMFRQTIPYRTIILDNMDTLGTKVSDETLTVNTFNYISGEASLERTFAEYNADPTINRISDELPVTIDITTLMKGVVVIPAVFQNAKNISKVIFELVESDTKYYTLTSTTDSVGDNFIDGLNMIRLSMAGATETGVVDKTNITEWRLKIETVTGETETVIIDRITIQQTAHYYFEYYSNRMFIDGTTLAWKEKPASGDTINLAQEARDVLHYETVLLIAQGNTKIRESRNGFDNFATQLKRKYQQYWGRYPSSEAPISYNTLRDGELLLPPEMVGDNLHADIGVDVISLSIGAIMFVDNETPTGAIDGVNTTYTLAHAPDPTSSLMMWINGTYLQQGVDYTISGNIITMTSPLSALFAGLPFTAFYRYVS